jgi:hypothetical protein
MTTSYILKHVKDSTQFQKPAEGDGFLRAIKILSTPSFGGKVKPLAPCRKILRHVKVPFEV